MLLLSNLHRLLREVAPFILAVSCVYVHGPVEEEEEEELLLLLLLLLLLRVVAHFILAMSCVYVPDLRPGSGKSYTRYSWGFSHQYIYYTFSSKPLTS